MDGSRHEPKTTAGLDLGDKYSYLCLIDQESGEVIKEGRLRTSPEAVTTIDGCVPDPMQETDPQRRRQMETMLAYMDLKPGTPMTDIRIDAAFLGSCTNARSEDLRAAAELKVFDQGNGVAIGECVAMSIFYYADGLGRLLLGPFMSARGAFPVVGMGKHIFKSAGRTGGIRHNG